MGGGEDDAKKKVSPIIQCSMLRNIKGGWLHQNCNETEIHQDLTSNQTHK